MRSQEGSIINKELRHRKRRKMPLFTSSSPYDGDVEKATSEMNTSENWGVIMDICDKVKNSNGSKDCLRSTVKRINHRVPFVSMQALTLLNACVNNCGRDFHLEICSRDFVSECRTLIGQKAHPRVAQKLKFMIKTWAELKEFKEDPALSLMPSLYDSLRKETNGEFLDPDSPVKTTPTISKDPNVVQSQQEEDDIAKAIALSLKENEKGAQQKTSTLYPTNLSSYGATAAPTSAKSKEVRKVRALYDFEAVEDNELTFKAGELISVLDDSDPNWWKGFNQRGEGLFPANFVTADLSVEPEDTSRKVQFNEEVEVKTIETPEEVEIDENKIDRVLQLIQNADPTGETTPDDMEMLKLEEQCKAMGPMIDTELEKIDRKHASLCEINQKVIDALQMYHNLMKEVPRPYSYKSTVGPTPGGGYPSVPGVSMAAAPSVMTQPIYNGHSQYMPPGGQMPQGQGQLPQGQGQMPQGQGQMQQGQGQMMPPQQGYSVPVSSQNYNASAVAGGPSLQTSISTPQSHLSQNLGPQQQQQYSQSMRPPVNVQQTEYSVPPSVAPQMMYQPQMQQQPLL